MLDPVQLLEYETGLFKDGKMARFGFCAASSLIWGGGGGGGLLFHFILSEIVGAVLVLRLCPNSNPSFFLSLSSMEIS